MNLRSMKREALAMALSILLLVAGLAVVWFADSVAEVDGEAVLVALLLVPIIAYAILSGRVSEVKAGGIEATFVQVAEQTVSGSYEAIELTDEEINRVDIVVKAGPRELQRARSHLGSSKPIVLAIRVGGGTTYSRGELLNYLKSLSEYRQFKFVIVLDQGDRVVAYTPAWALENVLNMDGLGSELVDILNDARIEDLGLYNIFVRKTILDTSSNLAALQEMTNRRLEAIVVTDTDDKLRGVVERDQIISKLLLGLASQAKS